MKKDLLGIGISRATRSISFSTPRKRCAKSASVRSRKCDAPGKNVVNLFYEPSTRTRTSFEIAEKRSRHVNIAVSTSSVLKGETS